MEEKKFNVLTMIYIIYIVLVFFAKWALNNGIITYFSLLVFFFMLILNGLKINKNIFKSVIILLLYIFLNVLLTIKNTHTYFLEELFIYTIPSIGIITYFYYLYKKDNNQSVLKKSRHFFNMYLIINFIIMLIQTKKMYFLMLHFSNNNFYTDHITGFMGANGTHRLSIFYLICLYSNMLFINDENKKIRTSSRFMVAFTLISSLYISTLNDNRAYYFALVIFTIPILVNIVKYLKINIRKFMRILLLLMLLLISSIFLYKTSTTFNNFINVEIVEKVVNRTTNNVSGNSSKNSEERIALFEYAIKNGNGYTIGKGIGNIKLLLDPTMPKHFGLCEITSRIYNGGIIYFCLLVYLYSNIILSFQKNKNSYKFFVAFVITFMGAYQQIFTICEETVLLSILFCYMQLYISKGGKEDE